MVNKDKLRDALNEMVKQLDEIDNHANMDEGDDFTDEVQIRIETVKERYDITLEGDE